MVGVCAIVASQETTASVPRTPQSTSPCASRQHWEYLFPALTEAHVYVMGASVQSPLWVRKSRAVSKAPLLKCLDSSASVTTGVVESTMDSYVVD